MTYRSQWKINEKTLGPAFFQKRAKGDEDQELGGKHIAKIPNTPSLL